MDCSSVGIGYAAVGEFIQYLPDIHAESAVNGLQHSTAYMFES